MVIRPIRPDDKPQLEAGLHHLSAASVHARFLSPKPRFTQAELRYLTEVDGIDHVALVLDDGEHVVGVARFVRLRDDPTSAEVGVVIADGLQGRGHGTRLGLALADEARRLGVEHFTAVMQPGNDRAMRLLRRLSLRLRSTTHHGVREVVADLPLAA